VLINAREWHKRFGEGLQPLPKAKQIAKLRKGDLALVISQSDTSNTWDVMITRRSGDVFYGRVQEPSSQYDGALIVFHACNIVAST
jgi:hypothetical protein